ncbi:hypothetical protein GCM10027187_18200 [Streptosporangium sandarakinum]|uniref:Uncharacterized protein n=1 Tax=Streptosporangium sandarakinum TaxID=1260955 RepID=A0A852V6J8_9ACTN|nr:hypothetical protein [Streptosporangium sandarakinum]
MVFSVLTTWLAVAIVVPTLTITIVSIVALRGTQPDQRPEILRALAILAKANQRSLPTLRRRSGDQQLPR